MSDVIRFACGACGKAFAVTPDHIGKVIKCGCGATIEIASAGSPARISARGVGGRAKWRSPLPPPQAAETQVFSFTCNACGETSFVRGVSAQTAQCRHCGADVTATPKAVVPPAKSSAVNFSRLPGPKRPSAPPRPLAGQRPLVRALAAALAVGVAGAFVGYVIHSSRPSRDMHQGSKVGRQQSDSDVRTGRPPRQPPPQRRPSPLTDQHANEPSQEVVQPSPTPLTDDEQDIAGRNETAGRAQEPAGDDRVDPTSGEAQVEVDESQPGAQGPDLEEDLQADEQEPEATAEMPLESDAQAPQSDDTDREAEGAGREAVEERRESGEERTEADEQHPAATARLATPPKSPKAKDRQPQEPTDKLVAALLKALDDASESTRLQAARSLGDVGAANDAFVIPALRATLKKDRSRNVRLAGLESLGKLGARSQEAAEAVVRVYEDYDDREVRRVALQGIGSAAENSAKAMKKLVEILRGRPAGLTRPLWVKGAKGQAESLDRWAALHIVREIGPPAKDAVPVVLELLKQAARNYDRSVGIPYAAAPDVFREAARTLAELGVSRNHVASTLRRFANGKGFHGMASKNELEHAMVQADSALKRLRETAQDEFDDSTEEQEDDKRADTK